MKYASGQIGRVFVVRFEDGDDVLGGVVELARKEGIRSAAFNLVGGMRRGRFVTGPEREEMPPVPIWRSLCESHEVTGFGTIFREGDEPKVHFHGAFGKRDAVRVGCLREDAETFLVLEAVVMELTGFQAVRERDPASGMSLLKL